MITMYDSTSVEDLPAGAVAYAGYVDGSWPTFGPLRARFPGAELLSITALGGTTTADCVDSEPGDVPAPHVPGWVHSRLAAGEIRPVVYCSQAALPAVLAALGAAGITRGQVRLWTAHYGHGQHLCSPASCGAPATADGTQWTDHGPNGEHYDISTLVDDFFAQPAPLPTPEVDDMPAILMRANGDGRWYQVSTNDGTKEYVPTAQNASERAFLGMKTNNGQPFVEDPAYLASLEDITPGGSPKPQPVPAT